MITISKTLEDFLFSRIDHRTEENVRRAIKEIARERTARYGTPYPNFNVVVNPELNSVSVNSMDEATDNWLKEEL